VGTDELRQLFGDMLLAAGIAQQALSHAAQIAVSPKELGFIETAAEEVTAIVQAALLACARAKDTNAQITIEDTFRINSDSTGRTALSKCPRGQSR
jgi:hypothetical protein